MESHSETQEISPQRMQRNYIAVFVALAVLTAIELGVNYLPVPRIPVLVPLALAKATLVAMFYMHLKYDRRVFSLVFVMGILMGVGMIIALTALFGPMLLDMK